MALGNRKRVHCEAWVAACDIMDVQARYMKGMSHMRRLKLIFAAILSGMVCWGAYAGWPLFLVDDSSVPRASIAWPTTQGQRVELAGQLGYHAPAQRKAMGRNVAGFITIGGTRVDKGVADPRGQIVRVGFYKIDAKKPFFEDLADNAVIEISLEDVRFNMKGHPQIQTVLQHCKYTKEDVIACGLSAKQVDLYNTYSRTDTLEGVVLPEVGRMGVLGEKDERKPRVVIEVQEDGSISMRARIPYRLLRHVKDPWRRTSPGGFREPYHFHVEFQVIPEAFKGTPNPMALAKSVDGDEENADQVEPAASAGEDAD